MTILVTGSWGFIGYHLTKALDKMGVEWRGFDLLEGDDIRDKETCLRKLEGVDIVIHLAAKTGVNGGEIDPNLYVFTNVVGTMNLLQSHIKHFIYFSSASVYGNQTPPNSEVTKTVPTSVYGKTKIDAEWYVKHSGIPYTIVRPFNVYGENGRPDQVLYKWKREGVIIRGDGTSKRGYTYVGDLIGGLLQVIAKAPTNDVYNFGSETPVSLNEVADLFDSERVYVPMPDNEIKESWADSFKATQEFGFSPTTDFKVKAREILENHD